MPNVFFTSDLHLGHENLVSFRNEVHGTSFKDAEEVNICIMEKWNERIRPKDLVWVLGDVVWGKEALQWLPALNGKKRLILGNHCTERLHISDYLPHFEEVHSIVKKYNVVMSHVPIHTEALEYRWVHNVHGHIHHPELDIKDHRYTNVNVDVRSFKPLSLDELREEINENTKISTNSTQK